LHMEHKHTNKALKLIKAIVTAARPFCRPGIVLASWV